MSRRRVESSAVPPAKGGGTSAGLGQPPSHEEVVSTSSLAKVTFASTLGTLLEWYDFFLAATAAAQVWPSVFFAEFSPATALAFSIASYGVTFFTRPVGAWIFGYLGDKMGRKSMLVWTLGIAGISMLGIALIPSYAAIGILAPILLNLFRATQGIGLGGEFGGSTSWVVEYASKSKHRALWSGWVQWSVPLGTVLSIISFIIVRTYTGSAFLDWGWRIPFVLGAVVAVVGIVIRYRLQDSPLFRRLAERREVERAPFSQMLRQSWRRVVVLAFLFSYITVIFSGLVNPTSLSYMAASKISPNSALYYVTYGTSFSLVTVIIGSLLGDRIGRKWVAILSTALTVVFALSFFPLLSTKDPINIILAEGALVGSEYLFLGVVPVVYNENFPTKYRYSGSGFSFQMGNLIAGIVITFVIPYVITSYGGVLKATQAITVVGVVFALVSLVAALFLKDTRDIQL